MTKDLDQYARAYADARRQSNHHPAWLTRVRDDALARFLSLGFPTTRDEEWRFTSVAPIAETTFRVPSSGEGGDLSLAGLRLPVVFGAEVVFVDGHYTPALSSVRALPRGATIESLASALATRPDDLEPHLTRLVDAGDRAFTALNTAFLAEGAYIRIPAHSVLEAPIHLVFISCGGKNGNPTISHPRTLAVIGDDSQVSIVESYAGADDSRYLTNAVTEIVAGENAVVDHYKLQHESVRAFHVGSMHVRLQRNANFASHSASLGGRLVRNEVVAVLDGEGGECTLNGLYLAAGERLVDNHTTIDHARPHCGSREIYKGILADHARGVFNGKIVVRPDAQKTDAKQTNRALLLSEDAQINTKPQLEIHANDVKCTHGAAVGQLDEEAVFYLRSRGLSRSDARRLLIQAFAGDVLNLIRLAPMKAGLEEMVLRQLARALPAAA